MRLARTPRRSFTMQGGRRGRASMSSYQAMFALCMGAGFFIVCMHWHHEVQNLPMENIPAGQPPKALRGDDVVVVEPLQPLTPGEEEVDRPLLPPPPPAGNDGQQQGAGGGGGGSDDDEGKAAKSLTAPSDDDTDDDGEDGSSSDGGGKGHGGNGQGDGDRGVPADGVKQEPGVGGGVVAGAGDGDSLLAAGGLVDPDQLRREERRARLNGLVAAAVERQRGQECNVAFVKTHKTASTTITAVLYRYGLRHGRRVARFKVEGTAVTLEHAAEETKESGNRVDIFHYHYVWNGYFESTWEKARGLFKDIMAEPVAPAVAAAAAAAVEPRERSGGGTKFVTVLRDPVDHWLSYFYFYYEPEMKMGVEEYFSSGRHKNRPLNNPLAAEFGIYNERDLDEFVLNHLPSFALTMLTEEVDEGLVLLGRVMGWDPIDITYASLLEARDGGIRWDDKPIKKAPRLKDLHQRTKTELERATKLDAGLYKAAKEAYGKVKELHSEGLEEAVADFRDLQLDVLAALNEGVGRGGQVSPARAWYMPESDYYFYSADKSRWWEEYYPPALPF